MKKICFLFIFTVPIPLFSQQENDIVRWNESRKLIWDDFKAEPLVAGSTAALTTTHLGFSYRFTNGKITYFIDSWFEKNKSWGRVKNDWVLQHEQGHFDIAEIYTRKLKKAVSEYRFDRKTFQQDLDKIYATIVDEKEKFQQLYDDETNYSRNKEKQEEWLSKIAALLKDLNAYADY
jgi:hypothetical protein